MRTLTTAALAAALLACAPAAPAAAKGCPPVNNPAFLDGTRYEGSDLRAIHARGVSCKKARWIARRATYKALGQTPPPTGIKRFGWKGWSVSDDLRGDVDRFVAKRGTKRVRWTFGGP